MESIRHSQDDLAWPLRPWIWAVICAAGAWGVNRLVNGSNDQAIWRQVAATFVIVATIGFVLTAELRRLFWALAFALGAGAVLAFVGWFTAAYNKGGNMAEYPFLAGIFALLIAAPLFQTVRDEGAWRFPYARLHSHVWTDAVIATASLAFTGVSFLLAFLIAQLFDLIGIKFFTELMREEWFGFALAGFAFGGALGLLRERDALAGTLLRLVLVIFSVLAPVLALALAGFLVSLPFTGLEPLWKSGVPTTPVLLAAAAGAAGLVNAVIGDGESDGAKNRVLRWSALILSCCILPLAVIAAISMGVRIAEYGFTPDRIWGVLATMVASVYGVAYLVAVAQAVRAKLPLGWDTHIRPANVRIAIGVCALALFLALPILDFGAVSARDQLARLKSGVTKPTEFDWQAMAFDFGPKGRAELVRLAKTGSSSQRESAKLVLAAKDRWQISDIERDDGVKFDPSRFTFQPSDRRLDDASMRELVLNGQCRTLCHVIWQDENRFLYVGELSQSGPTEAVFFVRTKLSSEPQRGENQLWQREGWNPKVVVVDGDGEGAGVLHPGSKVEIRAIQQQQVFVDGKAVGEPFEK
jgi:Domain of unknown function (DUF4153)